jgi:NhaA family Na+:H+ antiporter
MATDIAFALGALAVFGSRVPVGLKVFLTALAIADDLGAVAVIAIFYTDTIRWLGLAAAGVFLALLLVAVRLRIRRLDVLLPLIVGVWLGVFASGVHATVAGILVAMIVPVRARLEPRRSLETIQSNLAEIDRMDMSRASMVEDHEQLDAILSVHEAAEGMLPAGLRLEHELHPVQVWVILPLFALANAGVAIDGSIAATLREPIALGVVAGLVLGKPLGILAMSWLAVRSGRGALPAGVTWAQVIGAGFLAGIGFTMSLFVSELAFADAAMVAQAKIGILMASLVAGMLGCALLWRSLPRLESRGRA